jgi:hypothetical protein
MIDVTTAIRAAVESAATILEPPRNTNLLVEEVEESMIGDRTVWLITLSHPKPIGGLHTLANAMGSRDYKTFAIDMNTGKFLSMKIRELAHSE